MILLQIPPESLSGAANNLLQYSAIGAICLLLIIAVGVMAYYIIKQNNKTLALVIESKDKEVNSERSQKEKYEKQYLQMNRELLEGMRRMITLFEFQSKRLDQIDGSVRELPSQILNRNKN